MDLKQLLNMKDLSFAQLQETESLLQAEIDACAKKLADLDAEDKAQTTNRLLGKDTGAEARRLARDNANRASRDFAHVLAGVQAKIAIERARQAEETEAEAYGRAWEHLARRREAFREIDGLLDRVAELYGVMSEAYTQAFSSVPNGPAVRAWAVPGHNSIDKAIVVSLNTRLGFPLPAGEFGALEQRLRVNGLVSHLNESEDMVMGAPILNRDGGPIPASETVSDDEEADGDGGKAQAA